MNSLIINRAFFGKDNCVKVMLNMQKECYLHFGIKRENKYLWIKTKYSCEELGNIIRVLDGRKNTIAFYHSFNGKTMQCWINRKNEFVFFKVKSENTEITKSLSDGEQEVLAILLKEIIVRINIVE